MKRPDDAADFGFGNGDAWFENLAQAIQTPTLGTLAGHELLAEVGRGGQGVVYRARQPRSGQLVALKRLVEGRLASPSARLRFEREIELASSLQHPGIVAIYGVETTGDLPLLVMEWVDGRPITAFAGPGHPLEQQLRLFVELCRAVQHAHGSGVLHRDLKPSNVLVDEGGRPRVLDFGLARGLDAGGAGVTRTSTALGTPAYAAPEQLAGETTDVRADVYSLGVLLYELLTGEVPFAAEGGLAAQLRAIDAGVLTPPSRRRSELGRDVDSILAVALARDPERRYATVASLAEDVERALEHRPVLAHPPGLFYELSKLARRNRPAAIFAAALFLSLALFAIVAAKQSQALAAERDRESEARLAAQRATAEAERASEEALQASEEAQRASEAAKLASSEALRERDEAQTARAVAERQTERARSAMSFVLVDVLAEIGPGATTPTLSELLKAAADRVDARFAKDPDLATTLHGQLGMSLATIQEMELAEPELRRAIERSEAENVDPNTIVQLELALTSALAGQRRFDDARTVLQSARERIEGDESTPKKLMDMVLNVEQALSFGFHPPPGNSFDEVDEKVSKRDVASYGLDFATAARLASAGGISGNLAESQKTFEELVERGIELFGPDSARVAEARVFLGEIHVQHQRPQEAIEQFREALRVYYDVYGADDWHLGRPLSGMGDALGATPDGEGYLREAMRVAEVNHGPAHAETGIMRVSLARCLHGLGRVDEALGELEVALAAFEGKRWYRWLVPSRTHFVELLLLKKDWTRASEELDRLVEEVTQLGIPRPHRLWTTLDKWRQQLDERL